MTSRTCGSCTFCCKVVPVNDISPTKPANKACVYQRKNDKGGCKIYPMRPLSCRLWTCQWVTGADTHDVSRPDRIHCCIDVIPDYVSLFDRNGERKIMPVCIIWCDPSYPNAYQKLLGFLNRRAAEGMLAIVRYSPTQAIALVPPFWTGLPYWVIDDTGTHEAEHDAVDVAQAIGQDRWQAMLKSSGAMDTAEAKRVAVELAPRPPRK